MSSSAEGSSVEHANRMHVTRIDGEVILAYTFALAQLPRVFVPSFLPRCLRSPIRTTTRAPPIMHMQPIHPLTHDDLRPHTRPTRSCPRPSGTIAAVVLLTAALLPCAALADERVCRGTLGAMTVDNLRVPDQGTCTLDGTHVKGNVKIESSATLTATRIRVAGNIQAENHRAVSVASSRIGGSIQLVQGGRSDLQGNRVDSEIQLFENRGGQSVSNNHVGGNLQCKQNRSSPHGARNVVDGNKEDQCRGL